jgi:hypothetical protein
MFQPFFKPIDSCNFNKDAFFSGLPKQAEKMALRLSSVLFDRCLDGTSRLG